MIFFCPACWEQIPSADSVCPRCGTDPQSFSEASSFQEKLLRAVHHRDAMTSRRAIWILGQLRCRDAVPLFEEAAQTGLDVYQLLAIAEALTKIGGESSRRLLEHLCASENSIVAKWCREHESSRG